MNQPKRRSVALPWVMAVLITLLALAYQRTVGPTTPARGSLPLAGERITYRLQRSAEGASSHEVALAVPDTTYGGVVLHRRFRTEEPWHEAPMRAVPDGRGRYRLVGSIPAEPPGGKVSYQVRVWRSAPGIRVAETIPRSGPLVLRFRGYVPPLVLVPHVLLMFLGMLWSNRAGLEALRREGSHARLALVSLVLLSLGGMVLGPLVQWYAFGDAWTGVPFGWDLTDNKTLIAVVGWLAAVLASRRGGRQGRYWVLAAALVTLIVFSIPHSVMGTELDYETGKRVVAP